MTKIVRLTESQLKNIIKSSVGKILKEYTGDEEEFGRYDLANGLTDKDFYNIDAMNADAFEKEEQAMQEYIKDLDAEQFIGQEYWDPTDNELYRGAIW